MAGFSYDRYDSRRRAPPSRSRNVLTYWVPLLVTATVATGALATWVLKAREDHDHSTSDDDDDLSYGGDTDQGRDPVSKPPSYGVSEGVTGEDRGESSGRDESTLLGRVQSSVQSTIRRTPSPQQIYDGARVKVTAGVAAAGALMGGALSSIREGSDDDFADHERWRQRDARASELGGKSVASTTGGRRRTVAIVVSAEEGDIPLEEEESRGWKSEQASLLSHIPISSVQGINILVLIYAPRHQPHASKLSQNTMAASSLASSYSAINTPAATTPGDELNSMDPMPVTPALSAHSGSGSSYYDMIYREASRLVQDSVAIMPFGTLSGFTHMLKHLSPDVVYVADSLSGTSGKNVEDVKGWVGQVVVVIGGDGAGLVDDTDEEGGNDRHQKWWETSTSVGLGKGIEVVEAVRIGDDWERRVGGKE